MPSIEDFLKAGDRGKKVRAQRTNRANCTLTGWPLNNVRFASFRGCRYWPGSLPILVQSYVLFLDAEIFRGPNSA